MMRPRVPAINMAATVFELNHGQSGGAVSKSKVRQHTRRAHCLREKLYHRAPPRAPCAIQYFSTRVESSKSLGGERKHARGDKLAYNVSVLTRCHSA